MAARVAAEVDACVNFALALGRVDFDDYLFELGKELRRGSDRARARGFALPVAPIAARESGDEQADAEAAAA